MQNFEFTNQTSFYRGKVRDVYYIGDHLIAMVASNRISAFDVILPRPIPFKGQVLNQIAAYMLKECREICPNWLLEVPAPQVSIGLRCQPLKVEMVVRATLTGHAWRTYSSGERKLCGQIMPEGMQENDFFPKPTITPSTKAAEGHDEDISPEEIITSGLVSAADWELISNYSLALFKKGAEIADQRGLILADTKYEFGKIGDTIYLMDEIHTPDSSRYFFKEGFEESKANQIKPRQLSKEFVREWLIANNFMGKEGQQVPQMDDAWVNRISLRYIELYETLLGEKFQPLQLSFEETFDRTESSLKKILETV